MLEQRDLEAIALLLDNKLEKNNEQMKAYIDERFEKTYGYIDERFEKTYGYIDERFEKTYGYIDERFEKNNVSMKEFVREEITTQITRSESFLLEEMERMNKSTNSKIEFLQKKIDDLTQYYRITKLENDNTTLLLQLVSRLQKDVEELKKKIA